MSAADEMATGRRPVRGLPAPPVASETAPVSEPSPSVNDGEAALDPVDPPAPSVDSSERAGGQGGPVSARAVPARTAQRDPHSFRLYRQLSLELTRLVRELDDRGLDTDRTELLHALLYSYLPPSADAAEKLVRRWRRLQAGA